MVYRIEIKSKIPDSRNLVMLNKIKALGFGENIQEVKIVDVYTLNSNFNDEEVAKIAEISDDVVKGRTSYYYEADAKKVIGKLKKNK